MHTLRAAFAAFVSAVALILASSCAFAQTTAGSGTTIVVPVTAQTASFTSEITVFNPNGSSINVDVAFYEAQNSATPGVKTCTDVVVPANRSVQFSLAGQCTLSAASHFGLLVLTDLAGTNAFYGYARVQNPQGIGFSIEGFPAGNFNDQVSHATGLKKTAAGLIYQTNCFVGSLSQSVASYTLKLFNDATGAQIGITVTGSLNAFEQVRYLDIFGPAGVNAPPGNQLNVRAEFASTPPATLIGFCTVQDNTSFGADFRIAKSYGSPNAFVQGGNAFGTTAVLGTTDGYALDIRVNGSRVMRYEPNSISPNVIGGSPANNVTAGVRGATIAGGGVAPGDTDPDFAGEQPNRVTDAYGTVGGGYNNVAGNDLGTVVDAPFATVGGGYGNQASGLYATVAGGFRNWAYGNYSSVSGGFKNLASGNDSFVGGGNNTSAIGFASFAAGELNAAGGDFSAVIGGASNVAGSNYSLVAGGDVNYAGGRYSTVVGGSGNSATGDYTFVAGGSGNMASGNGSFAAGVFAKAVGAGSFVWADAIGFTFDPSSAGSPAHGWANPLNTFNVRATGGAWFVTGVDNTGQPTTGPFVNGGSGAWAATSDRAVKENFRRIDPQAILAKVAQLPIESWNYINEGTRIRHLGPVSQDFRAAFGLGRDDKSITSIDADGVALAAIQGLNQKLEQALAEKDRRIAELEQRVNDFDALRGELTEMRTAMHAAMAELSRERATFAALH